MPTRSAYLRRAIPRDLDQGKRLQIPIHMAEKSAKCSANRTWKRTLRACVTRDAAGAELFPLRLQRT